MVPRSDGERGDVRFGMSTARRWYVVGVGLVLLLLSPSAIGALPAGDSDISARELLQHVHDSEGIAYSGLAESVGAVQLPITDEFTGLADLLGGRTRLRVWWRGENDWRVDSIEPTGETDLFHDAGGTTTWEYESAQATRTSEPFFRLPRGADLLPPELGHRLLVGASPADVTRLPAERVAGRDAPGLRLEPPEPQASVARVDIWVDPETGLPLRVAVFGKGYDGAALTSTFLDLTTETPSASDTSFALPPGAELRFDDVVDVAAAADHLTDHFPGLVPPAMLAGLPRNTGDGRLGAVGDYGRGVTRLVAVPLWDEVAIPLREQLSVTPGVRVGSLGSAIRREALSLRLTHRELSGYSWLLIGTVTPRTLRTAAAQLAARPLGPR